MTKEKSAATPKKKVYKKPAQVKSVESGKIMNAPCPYNCGSQVTESNSNCGHY